MNKSLFSALVSACCITFSPLAISASTPLAIAIHGGAGTIEKSRFTPEQEKAYRSKLKEAVETGYKVLEQGGESLDIPMTAAMN
jgi:beta-aspartyl-peptidase (threonine type)